MADVRDWDAFIRGRWRWAKLGYERNLPRRIGFGDIDATIEICAQRLTIEAKAWDGVGVPPALDRGQLESLRDMAAKGDRVLLLWGCASCNNPLYIRTLAAATADDFDVDLRPMPIEARRAQLKQCIDSWAAWADQQRGVAS